MTRRQCFAMARGHIDRARAQLAESYRWSVSRGSGLSFGREWRPRSTMNALLAVEYLCRAEEWRERAKACHG